jgi:hypothetical protein
LQVDTLNCGACGNSCQVGQSCESGTCECQAGLDACESGCVDTAADADNCGSCGNVCPAGQVCSLGECTADGCAEGLTLCSASCVDTNSSPYHCGQCDAVCPAGQSCVNGACDCPQGQTLCGGQCVDTQTNLDHCGSCDSACTGGQACVAGACKCAGGQELCGNSCVDTQTDPANCGSCGNACGSGQSCSGGTCVQGTGGGTGSGGSANDTGGSTSSGASTGTTGGSTAAGGAITTGGSTATGGSTGSGGTTGSCGAINTTPLGCEFGWGAPDGSNRSSWLDFVSVWVGYESRGGLDGACDGCRLASTLASTNATLVYYAYFIGYQANLMGGFGDCNVDFDGANLCSHGAQWIRDNWKLIVDMYGNYAQATYQSSPNKPVIWWLEGDFVQYSYDEQNNPLSMAELGDLARDITCAIKASAPNAVVGMNHSPWISNEQSESFWSAMPTQDLDLVWVQGAGDTGTLLNSGDYNAATASYAWLHQKTGRPIMAETSFAGSGQDDRWTSASASQINARISEGVIAVLVNNPGSDYQSAMQSLAPQLNSVCQ